MQSQTPHTGLCYVVYVAYVPYVAYVIYVTDVTDVTDNSDITDNSDKNSSCTFFAIFFGGSKKSCTFATLLARTGA